MNVDIDDLVRDALALGVTHAAIATVADIKFNEDFRTQCEQNACGTYNKNWMCPPAVGQIAELKEKVLGFKQGLLIQTVHELKSSFDWKGMMASGHKHTEIFRTILDKFDTYGSLEILPLNVGPCTFCSRCTFLDNEPCRFPEKALSSVEASGIDVMALEKSSGIPYYNGKNTVSYVGLILFNAVE